MAEMLSPGVYVTEIDASTIAPTVSNSIAVFAGKFNMGPVGSYTLITTVDELITYYGLPSNDNYNDWYQAYNFLQYGNKLYVARAANVKGAATKIDGETINSEIYSDTIDTITVSDVSNFKVGNFISFGSDTNTARTFYLITSIDVDNKTVTLDRNIEDYISDGASINSYEGSINGVFEATTEAGNEVPTEDYLAKNITIGNLADFEDKESSIAFASDNAKLKIIAQNPGDWANDLEIAIARPDAFGDDENPTHAFDGIYLDDLFEYFPTGTEVGVIVKYNGTIKEIFTVDFDPTAKDINGKSTYVENVINNQSKYIFVKDNTGIPATIENDDVEVVNIKNYCAEVNGIAGTTIELVLGTSSSIQEDDLADAYELWSNKEEVDIDIVIANEIDGGAAVFNLCDTRKDCIGFVGAEYGQTVGKKASEAVKALIDARKSTTETTNFSGNNMFIVSCANYKYQYDRYNDKNRWVNIAADVAGLRAATSSNRASWWASAGLERGQIKNSKKLAFNPNQGHRDLLYKNGLNPICTFPGQGTVMWGQKTLLDKPSSFDRANIRGLFNTLERSLSKMAKYQVMEFNDSFTRNRIVSMIKPFLSSVQAGRGIQDYLVVCDSSNNTNDVISRNQLVVDIYIKPTYVAEFVHLKFTNAGTNSFSSVVGG